MRTGAELLVDCLIKQDVKYIFGIPGAKIDAVFDALLDTPIKVILCRHEQNAAFMAAAYGRITGKPGVVLVTSGPGVSNLATGLLTANTEGDPIVAIGGNVPATMKHKESHQSTDNIKLVEAVTKARVEVLLAENIPEMIENAFRIATRPRSGAVFISVPQDVLKQKTDIKIDQRLSIAESGYAPNTTLEKAAKIIREAKLPVLLLGAESSRSVNTVMIREFLKRYPIPTIGTYQAAGVVSHDLVKYFVGRVGLFKNQPGDKLLDLADVVITVGYNPVEYDPEIWNARSSKKIIHVDYNPADIHTDYLPTVEVIGSIALNLEKIALQLPADKTFKFTDEIKKLQQDLNKKIHSEKQSSDKLIHPLHFINVLSDITDDNTTVISDIGSHYMWLARYYFSYNPHHLLFSNGQQTLGVALPWAMATRLARPKEKIISISGDGGFLFSATELETAVREKLPLVHCVWCDGTYNMVLEQQMMKYHRESAVHFGYVDIVKFAESFGATGLRVTHPNELKDILQKALDINGPVLVEIPIDYADNPELFATSREEKHI